MFNIDREWNKELEKLRHALWKLITSSREFKSFRKKLAQRNMDVDIFLAMFVLGRDNSFLHTSQPHKIRSRMKRKTRLSKEDIYFLKRIGVKWE
jgi:hypothetical protein